MGDLSGFVFPPPPFPYLLIQAEGIGEKESSSYKCSLVFCSLVVPAVLLWLDLPNGLE